LEFSPSASQSASSSANWSQQAVIPQVFDTVGDLTRGNLALLARSIPLLPASETTKKAPEFEPSEKTEDDLNIDAVE